MKVHVLLHCADCNDTVLTKAEVCGMGMQCKRFQRRLSRLFDEVEALLRSSGEGAHEGLRAAMRNFHTAGDRR